MPRRFGFRAFAHDESGAIAISGAVFAICGLAALAIGVDMASVYVEKRRAQGATDLAAIAAARDPDKAVLAAAATLVDNKVYDVRDIRITRGVYTANPAIPVSQRFVPNATPANAVMVEVVSRAKVYFGKSFFPESSLEVVTRATAVSTSQAAFTVGSRLLSLDGGILNAVLNGLLGGNVSLTVMDYNALAGYNVDLFKFSNALGTSVVGQAGTYEQLANANVTVGKILDVLIDVARNNGGGAQVDFALKQIKNNSNANNVSLSVKKLLDFGQSASLDFGQGQAALNAKASALSILQASAEVANGVHQADISTALNVAGLASTTLGITIGERPQSSPWIRFGDKGIEVYTAQTRIRLVAEVNGLGLLLGLRIRLPVYIDIAAARARLADMTCGADPQNDMRVTLAVKPAVINAWIGEPVSAQGWKAINTPPNMAAANIISSMLVNVTGSANAAITNLNDTNVTFRYADINSVTPKNVKTTDFTQSLVASLAGSLSLGISVGPLSLLTPAILGPAIRAALTPVAGIVDGLLNTVLKTLGIGLGEADVWVNGVRCDGAALVR